MPKSWTSSTGYAYERTELHQAVIFSDPISNIRRIIDNGADVNARDAFGSTPLYYARNFNIKKKSQIKKLLIAKGATE